MAAEIVQEKESNPLISPPSINSKSRGAENMAKMFGNIADRAVVQAGNYANEASKANLLQNHGMIQDVEAQSKIGILKSPGHATAIAQNASQTIAKIKSDARLNRADRLNLGTMADTAIRGLNLTAAERSISLARQSAREAFLSKVGDTLQSIRHDIHVNPEQADALIAAQYEAVKGQVQAGIITGKEAATLHKQFTAEMNMAHELTQGIKDGILTASDASMYHASQPGNIATSNDHLPIDHGTAMNYDHHYGQLELKDLTSKADSGGRVSTLDLMGLKKTTDIDKFFNHAAGSLRATGDINSTTSWVELKSKLDYYKGKDNLSSWETGYKNRLNNWINDAEQPGHYQNFIAGTPEGARIWDKYNQTSSVINSDVMFGDDDKIAAAKQMQHDDNLNDLISKQALLGVGMNYPDHLRQPIPLGILQPIANVFEKGGDISQAIHNIQTLSLENRVYAMNAFKNNPRLATTIYEVGNLANKADPGFLVTYMQSQQVDALGEGEPRLLRSKDKQETFMQLEQDGKGFSDKKLASRIKPQLMPIMNWLNKQPDGSKVASGKIDGAVRYVKYVAAQHGDYSFANVDEYIDEYARNMETAYSVSSGNNYSLDNNNVPLEDNQKQILASHALNQTREKLLQFNTPEQVNNIFTSRAPMLVSSPGKRIEVIYADGQRVVDANGHPAYSEIYTESVWQAAEHDRSIITKNKRPVAFGSGFELALSPQKEQYLRGSSEIIRPIVEGNIDLEHRPKIFDDKGRWSTVRTITAEFDGKTVLLPTIINGVVVSPTEAKKHYIKTGEHMGIFKTREEADKYDEQLHQRMGWAGSSNKWGNK